MTVARSVRVRGIVQGVGFRPFVYRLAQSHSLAGWVLNGEDGVDIHVEGLEGAIDAFVGELKANPPPASQITGIDAEPCGASGFGEFTIRETRRAGHPSTRISPDLPVCAECLAEMRDPADPRYGYPYINCTNCGPRFTVIESLPYDRCRTTMKAWPMCELCAGEYHDPSNRRFHAEPIACPQCGPRYAPGIHETIELLKAGSLVAIKGLGGYHLACDARNEPAVRLMRERKFRKEKPFAVMAANLEVARTLIEIGAETEALLTSAARPIVLARALAALPGIAPDTQELGVMLPYTPLHHLLFDAGAPDVLVMTSANRSSEPIAYRDDEARLHMAGIADALLVGDRPIARRVDDSVARVGAFGPAVLRRSRGYAPGAVCTIPSERPILAVGPDLKNTVTLVTGGQAFVSQHIGDLEHYDAIQAFEETIADLLAMYEIDAGELTVAHDAHPEYVSTVRGQKLGWVSVGIQHHRAHIASVIAERQAWDRQVIGVSFDGTGYGDDGSIWGGEFFAGSVTAGFERVRHMRPACLPGGDAAARNPVQCAAGFLARDLSAEPFCFPPRYRQAREMMRKQVRTFTTTSVGRLFDAAAALLGFTREITHEGQAAMWLESLARTALDSSTVYPFPELDYEPLLDAVIEDRVKGRDRGEIARAFQRGVARGMCDAVRELCELQATAVVCLSGGVFQNDLLLADIKEMLPELEIWTNHSVPPNDGGISLGQAALAAFPHA